MHYSLFLKQVSVRRHTDGDECEWWIEAELDDEEANERGRYQSNTLWSRQTVRQPTEPSTYTPNTMDDRPPLHSTPDQTLQPHSRFISGTAHRHSDWLMMTCRHFSPCLSTHSAHCLCRHGTCPTCFHTSSTQSISCMPARSLNNSTSDTTLSVIGVDTTSMTSTEFRPSPLQPLCCLSRPATDRCGLDQSKPAIRHRYNIPMTFLNTFQLFSTLPPKKKYPRFRRYDLSTFSLAVSTVSWNLAQRQLLLTLHHNTRSFSIASRQFHYYFRSLSCSVSLRTDTGRKQTMAVVRCT